VSECVPDRCEINKETQGDSCVRELNRGREEGVCVCVCVCVCVYLSAEYTCIRV
jgi:hypothetical protein